MAVEGFLYEHLLQWLAKIPHIASILQINIINQKITTKIHVLFSENQKAKPKMVIT